MSTCTAQWYQLYRWRLYSAVAKVLDQASAKRNPEPAALDLQQAFLAWHKSTIAHPVAVAAAVDGWPGGWVETDYAELWVYALEWYRHRSGDPLESF